MAIRIDILGVGNAGKTSISSNNTLHLYGHFPAKSPGQITIGNYTSLNPEMAREH